MNGDRNELSVPGMETVQSCVVGCAVLLENTDLLLRKTARSFADRNCTHRLYTLAWRVYNTWLAIGVEA